MSLQFIGQKHSDNWRSLHYVYRADADRTSFLSLDSIGTVSVDRKGTVEFSTTSDVRGIRLNFTVRELREIADFADSLDSDSDNRNACVECGEVAVGTVEGTPLCAAHGREFDQKKPHRDWYNSGAEESRRKHRLERSDV